MTTVLLLHCGIGTVSLRKLDSLPSFVPSDNELDTVGRNYQFLGLSLGYDFHVPFCTDTQGQVALSFGTRVGYNWQLYQRRPWAFRGVGTERAADILGGPSLETSGLRLDMRASVTLYLL